MNSTIPPINPASVDSLIAFLPKQVTDIDNTVTPATLIYSIKYDTTNPRIDLYLDDTTNSNPYDELAATYMYDNSGYLIDFSKYNQGKVSETNTIDRDGDNKILWIAHENKDIDIKDTTYFSYQIFSGGTKITTIVNSYYQGIFYFQDTLLYTYDAEFKLMEIKQKSETRTYEYNANKSLRKIFNNDPTYSVETNFFYTSGIEDGKEDIVLKTFLGKDYYIQNIKDLYTLASFKDSRYLTVSATDPFHLTRMQDIINENGQIMTEEREWGYELNDHQMLHKIIGSLDGQQQTTSIFKY